MNLSKTEKKIVKEILEIKNSNNITVGSVFLKIIKNLKDEIKYTSESNEYIFKDKKSLEYLEIISYTFKKLIDNNLIIISKLPIKNEKNISIIFSNDDEELNDFLILELKSILDYRIYITSELKDLFKYDSLKISIIFLHISYVLGGPFGIYFLWNLVLKTIGFEIKNIYIIFFLLLEFIFLGILIYKNLKNLIKFFKYPYLNENIYAELAFWSFIVTIFSSINIKKFF